MAPMHRRFSLILIAGFVLVVSSCSGDDGDAITTTTSADAGTVTSLGAAGGDDSPGGTDTTASPGTGDTTTTTAAGGNPPIPEFEILERTPGEEGDTVVVLLDPSSYTSLNDIDLRNVIAEVVDDFGPVYEAHLIDDERVAPLLGEEELTPEEEQLLDLYYLARLDEGFRISFEGPFADVASTVLGS
jgi:hypothetical protein